MEKTAPEHALAVMAAHIEALNQRDAKALASTLHFPHHRLSGTQWKTWDTAEHYFDDFLKRAGSGWARSAARDINVLDSSNTKVHLDVEICRFDDCGNLLTQFRSLWVIIEVDGIWAAKIRSSFAVQ